MASRFETDAIQKCKAALSTRQEGQGARIYRCLRSCPLRVERVRPWALPSRVEGLWDVVMGLRSLSSPLTPPAAGKRKPMAKRFNDDYVFDGSDGDYSAGDLPMCQVGD
jgi:hypothetical protein